MLTSQLFVRISKGKYKTSGSEKASIVAQQLRLIFLLILFFVIVAAILF